MVSALLAATTPEARREAVGSLGTSIERADGTWIAIGYRDSHGIPGTYSCAVAACSDGSWFESSEHFCGQFQLYDRLDEDPDGLRQRRIVSNVTFTALESAKTAASLSEAKQKILNLGFTPMTGPKR
jgi:hypothetical protein